METIYDLLEGLKQYLPVIMLIGVPFGIYGAIRMSIHRKYKLLIVSILSLGIFMISRFINSQMFPTSIESLDTFLKNMNYFEMFLIIVFMSIGTLIGSKKKCPNCKSIDYVVNRGKRLISSQSLGTDRAHNGAGQRGGHSVIRERVKETYETAYTCKGCNFQWTEQTTSNKTKQRTHTY